MIAFIKKLLHIHHWSSCPEDQVDDMGCFEYRAVCKCGATTILGGTLTPADLSELRFRRKKSMTEREMFEKSFQRPKDYFKRSAREQWDIDARLGILDWNGDGLSEEDIKRFRSHYEE